MRVAFTVEGSPVPKARPRTVRKGGRTWSYTPRKVQEWEERVREEAAKHFPQPLEGPVALSLVFYLRRPKSRRKDNYVSTAPDLDNLEKALIDGLNGAAFHDDRQVVIKTGVKRYTVGGRPRVEVVVTSLLDQTRLPEFQGTSL